MNAGAPGAPQRTSTARQQVRYGLRWRARDMARSARHWTAQGPLRLAGLLWCTVGTVMLLLACTAPVAAHPAAPCTAGTLFCLLGAAACTRKRRRR